MGYHSWMRGTLTLPVSQVAGMQRTLTAAHNARRKEVVAQVSRLWALVKDMPAARRYEWLRSIEGHDASIPRRESYSPSERGRLAYVQDRAAVEAAVDLFRRSDGRKPSRQHLADAGLAPATTSTKSWRDGDLHVRITGRQHLEVEVTVNPDAVQRANDSVLGYAMFHRLNLLDWTARNGGELVGNHELNEESGGEDFAFYHY